RRKQEACETRDGVARGQQLRHQDRAEVTGAAGNQDVLCAGHEWTLLPHRWLTSLAEHLMQTLDLVGEIEGVVADEEAVVVCSIGVRRGASMDLIVKILNDVVAQKVASGDDAEPDIGMVERRETR